MPEIAGLLESVLYVDDLKRAVGFFAGVLQLKIMLDTPRLVALDAGRQGVLLLFRRGLTEQDVATAGGVIPGHDGAGRLHMAFAIAADDYAPWKQRLTRHGIAIRSEVAWPGGGHSLYIDDPDGHVIELATPGLWPNY